MKSDTSRIADLDTLYEALQNRSLSVGHKEYLERVLDRILRETKQTRQLRDKLMTATRAGDHRTKKYIIEELVRIRQNELGSGNKDYMPIKL